SSLHIVCSPYLRHFHTFPTRRSSDLVESKFAYTGGVKEKTCLEVYSDMGAESQIVFDLLCKEITLCGYRAMYMSQTDLLSLLKRSEEHTSELQSRENLVCRLLLEKKK